MRFSCPFNAGQNQQSCPPTPEISRTNHRKHPFTSDVRQQWQPLAWNTVEPMPMQAGRPCKICHTHPCQPTTKGLSSNLQLQQFGEKPFTLHLSVNAQCSAFSSEDVHSGLMKPKHSVPAAGEGIIPRVTQQQGSLARRNPANGSGSGRAVQYSSPPFPPRMKVIAAGHSQAPHKRMYAPNIHDFPPSSVERACS